MEVENMVDNPIVTTENINKINGNDIDGDLKK
jgi:hypothetical protein